MKRGIIRIIAGIVMIILQIVVSIAAQPSLEIAYSTDIWYNIGFYSVGITGAILLFFGIRVISSDTYSRLILHSNTKAIHNVARWVMFSIYIIFSVFYANIFLNNWPNINFFVVLMLFAMVSFALYMLFYVYKKPCCLFSTALIFTGVAYLYNNNLIEHMLSWATGERDGLYLFLGSIPSFITGILYIIIAVKLYKERFSVKTIKALGWIAFVFEFVGRVLYNLIVFPKLYLFYINELFYMLVATGILLYISVFELNTLQEPTKTYTDDTIKFCRKCGTKLFDGSEFCSQCGVEVVKEQKNDL